MNIYFKITLTAYFLSNLYVIHKINQADYLDEGRRKLHVYFIWIVPFIGPLLIRNFWKTKKDKKLEVITKAQRKTDKGSFHESGKGIYG